MAAIYEPENLELEVKNSDDSLLTACIRAKIPISHACEGMASCGTCRVIVGEGLDQVGERNSLEQEMADDRTFSSEERLACQILVQKNFKFKLPED